MCKVGLRLLIAFLLVLVIGATPLLAADLRVTTENGVTTVVYNGQQVFKGNTTGKISSKAVSDNGVELAAAYDDERVIWENVAGAGQQLKGR